MRATDIIRNVLDLLDTIEGQHDISADVELPVKDTSDQEPRRFKQVFAMLDNPSNGDYSNTPNEIVSTVRSVTTDAGGGVNGPKHPADIRVKDPRGFE